MAEGKPAVGFVGLGMMGRGMARNLAAKGFPLYVYRHRGREAVRDVALAVGHLHQVLEGASQLAALNSFCAALDCSHADVSSDGLHIELPRVFGLMRKRGIEVAEPKRAPMQPRPGFTGWLVHVRMPRAEFDIGFFTPNPAPAGTTPKKARKPSIEHA